MRKNLPDKDIFIGKKVPDQPGEYVIIEHRGSGMNGHVFRAHSDELRRDIAVKIIPKPNLGPKWKQEFQKANSLRSTAVVKFFSVNEWCDSEHMIDCVVLLSEYIYGNSLREYIQKNKKNIFLDFIMTFLTEIFGLFHELDEIRDQHGDLHSGNILVEDRSALLTGSPYAFRITDFSVTSAAEGGNVKDDYENLAFVLKDLLENVDYQNADSLGKYTFNILNDHFLSKHLMEKDTSIDPYARRPKNLFERLNEIESDFEKNEADRTFNKIKDPFEYLSCEHFGDSHNLLRTLYSDRFLGLSSIETRNNLVLTGPRGCGKSTVFKSLSLPHRFIIDDARPDELTYAGIYYRCDDLYFSFPRYRIPDRPEAFNVPMHFVISTLISELFNAIKKWALRYYENEFEKKEEKVSKSAWELLELNRPPEPGIDSFKALSNRLQKERIRAAQKQRFANDPKQGFGFYFGPDILIKICTMLTENFSFFQNRPFYFFIDDYSSPKITTDLQQNLNRLFMQRTSSCFFKLSTESTVSYTRSDIDNKAYVEGREFTLMNLGLNYIHAKDKEKLRFIEDIFRRRLKAIDNYPVSDLDTLLGSYEGPNYNEAAEIIRKGKKVEVWGKESLCRLCCGDIYHIIDLVKQMVVNIGGTEGLAQIESSQKISSKDQTKAIREQAGNFLKGLRILPNGSQLVEIVSSFGNVAHSYLKHRNSKNVQTNPPWQAHRIEPYEQLAISDEAQKIYDELLRYSVFIEDVRGKSRRGKVVPRLYLRRLLIPHFNLTFSTRDSVGLEPDEIQELLLTPKEFEKRHLIKKGLNEDPDQLKFPGFDKED
ncbi:MAG: protein kinase [Thermodesulfobacteriota bacterium]|nr:protein kinase [Thermodesulfobacteriota bacterium]